MKSLLNYWKQHKKLNLYFSVGGSIAMGCINLISALISFSWLFLNYALVSFLFAIARIVFAVFKNRKSMLLIGAISLSVIIVPLTVSMVLTILEKEPPSYPFFWVIYAYALYGTIKVVMAIKGLGKKNKNNFETALTFSNLISALFTVELIEFALIETFGAGNKILPMQLTYQAGVVAISLSSVIYLFIKHFRSQAKNA